MIKTVFDFFDAYRKLYVIQPADKITVTDLARIAGYHRNTFYTNFHSIDDLLEQLENRVADEVVRQASDFFCNPIQHDEALLQAPNGFECWLRLLFERDDDFHFSELLFKKSRPIWEQGYHSAHTGMCREIEIEYKIRGTIAAMSYYCRNKQEISLNELYVFLRKLAKK